jgi:hypothetical protein
MLGKFKLLLVHATSSSKTSLFMRHNVDMIFKILDMCLTCSAYDSEMITTVVRYSNIPAKLRNFTAINPVLLISQSYNRISLSLDLF